MFTHKCDTGNLSALIQCWNIEQQIERDCFSVAKRRSIYIYMTLAFLVLLGAPYIYEISSLRVKQRHYILVIEIPLSAVVSRAAMHGRAFAVKDTHPATLCCCTLAYMLGFLLLLQTLIHLCSRSQWLSLPKIDTTWAGQHLRNHSTLGWVPVAILSTRPPCVTWE